MSTDKDPWHKGYASDYFSSDEDDEVDTSHRRTILSAEAKLKKDLDFNSRYDPAIFKETPFTHATINAARNLRSDSDNPPSQARPGPSSNTAVDSTYTGSPWKVKNGSSASTSTKSKALTQAASRPVPGRNIPVSNPDPGGRMDATKLAVQQEESKKEEMKKKEQVKAKKKDWSTNSGWKEKGKPVPATKTKKAADDQTRSVVDQVTDVITSKPNTGRAKKTATAAKKDGPTAEAGPATSKKGAAKPRVAKGKGKVKGVKQDQEKITFTRIRESIFAVCVDLSRSCYPFFVIPHRPGPQQAPGKASEAEHKSCVLQASHKRYDIGQLRGSEYIGVAWYRNTSRNGAQTSEAAKRVPRQAGPSPLLSA